MYGFKESSVQFRDSVLMVEGDIAFDLDLLSEHRNENIMIHSLLREVSASTVKNQFNRISRGGVEITPYNFYFTYKKSKQEGLDEIGKIAFEVKGHNAAYWQIFKFESEPTIIAEFERICRIFRAY